MGVPYGARTRNLMFHSHLGTCSLCIVMSGIPLYSWIPEYVTSSVSVCSAVRLAFKRWVRLSGGLSATTTRVSIKTLHNNISKSSLVIFLRLFRVEHSSIPLIFSTGLGFCSFFPRPVSLPLARTFDFVVGAECPIVTSWFDERLEHFSADRTSNHAIHPCRYHQSRHLRYQNTEQGVLGKDVESGSSEAQMHLGVSVSPSKHGHKCGAFHPYRRNVISQPSSCKLGSDSYQILRGELWTRASNPMHEVRMVFFIHGHPKRVPTIRNFIFSEYRLRIYVRRFMQCHSESNGALHTRRKGSPYSHVLDVPIPAFSNFERWQQVGIALNLRIGPYSPIRPNPENSIFSSECFNFTVRSLRKTDELPKCVLGITTLYESLKGTRYIISTSPQQLTALVDQLDRKRQLCIYERIGNVERQRLSSRLVDSRSHSRSPPECENGLFIRRTIVFDKSLSCDILKTQQTTHDWSRQASKGGQRWSEQSSGSHLWKDDGRGTSLSHFVSRTASYMKRSREGK